jgi:chromosome segregation ATPase
MNDEQQLWRDVQKFMNQFPGFVAVAKKIGEIGDLVTWQASEQHKLETITQEIERQRAAIASERAAADKEAARKLQESETKLAEHAKQMQADKESASTSSSIVVQEAQAEAHKIVGEARAKAKELSDVIEPKKAALEANIAELMDKMLKIKGEHEATQSALAKAKDDHSSFLKKLLGTADA